MRDEAFLFDCQGARLPALLSRPVTDAGLPPVLVVVGGPQYRVGSHRQFVLLARALARAGCSCMRFDYRGMGDAEGAPRDFAATDADIGAAIDALLARCPGSPGVVLWGLCDGASAAAFRAAHDGRVLGLALANPWVRTAGGEARVMLRDYYLQRLCTRAFWRKLIGGAFDVRASLRSLLGMLGAAAHHGAAQAPGDALAALPLNRRVPCALQRAGRPVLVLLSGRDYVAAEWEAEMAGCGEWSQLCAAGDVSVQRFEQASHTFSSAAWRAEVERATVDWLHERFGAGAVPSGAGQ